MGLIANLTNGRGIAFFLRVGLQESKDLLMSGAESGAFSGHVVSLSLVLVCSIITEHMFTVKMFYNLFCGTGIVVATSILKVI